MQILLHTGFENKMFLQQHISFKGSPVYFKVGGFIQSRTGTKWALIKQCTLLSPKQLSQLPDLNDAPFVEVLTSDFFTNITNTKYHYIELSNEVRKVGVMHNCRAQGSCNFSSDTLSVTHSNSTLDAGRFYLLNKRMGYPPRRS